MDSSSATCDLSFCFKTWFKLSHLLLLETRHLWRTASPRLSEKPTQTLQISLLDQPLNLEGLQRKPTQPNSLKLGKGVIALVAKLQTSYKLACYKMMALNFTRHKPGPGKVRNRREVPGQDFTLTQWCFGTMM